MHKESFIIDRNTLLHVSTLLGHLQGEPFVIVTLRLHFIVEWECAVDCVLRCFWRRELSVVPACTAVQQPSRVETCRSVLQLVIKLSLCICWSLAFLYKASLNTQTIHQLRNVLLESKRRRNRLNWTKIWGFYGGVSSDYNFVACSRAAERSTFLKIVIHR
jgi:hypothetical protein